MDEPFSALDAVLREHLQHFLKQLRERHPCTMVFVTHDIGEAVYLGEYIMLLGARPSRVAAFGANPSFTADAGVDVRGTDAFYAVQRRLHNAVAAVRIGKELHLTDGRGDERWNFSEKRIDSAVALHAGFSSHRFVVGSRFARSR